LSSIYLHIPFCERKCIYCDFYSIENKSKVGNFLQALHQEIDLYKSIIDDEDIETIYIGGGTPSLLTIKEIVKILNHLQTTFHIKQDAEITIEVNPGTVNKQRLSEYLENGINRLSIGVQSFNENDLHVLSRIHSVTQAIDTIESAKSVGFNNLNIDLIYAIPGQTISIWQENLERMLEFQPQHISAYSLIIEENTPLEKMVKTNLVSPIDSELEAEMYSLTMERLTNAGYVHYEVSNYSKPGFQSKHNCNYWNHSDYFGFGPSAHSFQQVKRWWNVRDLNSYCEKLCSGKLPIENSEILSKEDMFNESVMFAIRQNKLQIDGLESKFNVSLSDSWNTIFKEMESNGYLRYENGIVKLNNKGFLICDSIIEKLVSRISLQ